MSYYLNIAKRTLHDEKCRCVKCYASGGNFDYNWIKFGSLDVAKKHCKKEGRQYKYCRVCCGSNGGKIVK